MVRHSGEVYRPPAPHFKHEVWATNVLIFSIVYQRSDRGGPEARANHTKARPDWLFPQQSVPGEGSQEWRPTFIDYLFLSFCTTTAFSPAEAQPLTPRAMCC